MGPDLEKQVFGATVEREAAGLETEPLTSTGAPSRSTEIQRPPPVEENPFHDNVLEHASGEKYVTRTNSNPNSPPLNRVQSKRAVAEANECTMWPSLDQLKKRARSDKRLRSKNPMARLGKKGKIIASVIIAMCIMGLAVGIGVGVSRATHGEVWAGNGKTNPIPG